MAGENTTGAIQSTGASPSSGNSGASSSSTVNMGMAPGSVQSSSAPSRLSADQLFQDYGKEIFDHPRFKELTGYKSKWEGVAPLAERYGGPEGLANFEQYFGGVWNRLSQLNPDQANAVWQKIHPILNAIATGSDFETYLAKQEAAQNNGTSASANKDGTEDLRNTVKSLEERLNGMTAKERQREVAKVETENYNSYEDSFQKMYKDAGFPEEHMLRAGKLVVSSIVDFMPKGRDGRPLNPLWAFNEQALKDCFEKEIVPFISGLQKSGVTSAITRAGGPTLPNTNGQGGSPVAGAGKAGNRNDKASRLAQFFQTGR